MAKLIDLLKSLGTKGKLDLTKAEYNAVLEATKDIEVPKDFADQLEASLMTVDAAINNKDVRGRITAEVLNGEDAYLTSIVSDLDIDDEAKTSITSEKDTKTKLRKAITTLNEAKKKAKKSGDNVTEEALKQQVAELNKELKSVKDTFDADRKKLNADRDNDYINYKLMSLLGAKQYALPDKMSMEQKIKTALLGIQDVMAQKNLKVVKTDTGVKLVKADGTDPYNDKNTLLELPSFLDGVLAENGLLKNSDPSQGNNGSQQSHIITGTNGNDPAPKINTQYLNEVNGIIDGLLQS